MFVRFTFNKNLAIPDQAVTQCVKLRSPVHTMYVRNNLVTDLKKDTIQKPLVDIFSNGDFN